MQMSPQINELAAALAKAQGEMKPALKDSANPFFKSKYADLSSVWDSCREVLSKNGLAVVQLGDGTGGDDVSLVTVLTHSSGQWISGRLCVRLDKGTAQAIGSAITYFRRYGLSAIVGVSTEDDDGQAASHTKPNVTIPVKVYPQEPSYEAPPFQANEPMPNFDEIPNDPVLNSTSQQNMIDLSERKMTIGKHTGKTMHEIAAGDSNWSYAAWIDNAIKRNIAEGKKSSESFLIYREYAKSCGAPLSD